MSESRGFIDLAVAKLQAERLTKESQEKALPQIQSLRLRLAALIRTYVQHPQEDVPSMFGPESWQLIMQGGQISPTELVCAVLTEEGEVKVTLTSSQYPDPKIIGSARFTVEVDQVPQILKVDSNKAVIEATHQTLLPHQEIIGGLPVTTNAEWSREGTEQDLQTYSKTLDALTTSETTYTPKKHTIVFNQSRC